MGSRPPSGGVGDADFSRTCERYVRDWGVLGASFGVVHDRQLAWGRGFGLADSRGRECDSRTLYEIGSITKTFTSSAVLQLRDRGLLSLDDPLVEFLPELVVVRDPFAMADRITVRHALHHVSGLQVDVPSPHLDKWPMLSTAALLGALDQVSVVVEPGTRVKYSNLAYQLLGEVITRVSGRDLWEYFQTSILDPLGMQATTHAPGPELAEDCAQGHFPRGPNKVPTPAPLVSLEVKAGDGGLWSCVSDLALWVALHLRRDGDCKRESSQVLSASSVAEIERPCYIADFEAGVARGLGWFSWRDEGRLLHGHSGILGGFSSAIVVSPEERLGAIVLANGMAISPSPGDSSQELLRVARKILPSRPSPPAAGERARGEYAALVGRYSADEFGVTVQIEVRDGRLVCVTDDVGVIRLLDTSDPMRFMGLDSRLEGEAIRFFQGNGGEVAGVNLGGFPLFRQ